MGREPDFVEDIVMSGDGTFFGRMRDVSWVRDIVQAGEVKKFVTAYAAAKQENDDKLSKFMWKVLAEEKSRKGRSFDEIFPVWQMREAVDMVVRKQEIDYDQLTVPARVAFHLAQDAQSKNSFLAKEGVGIPFEYGLEAAPQVEAFVHKSRGTPFDEITWRNQNKIFKWLAENKEDVLAFGKRYPDAKLVMDKLSEHDEPLSIRFHSALRDTLDRGLQTTRKVKTPRKAAFGGKTHAQ